MQLLVTGGAGFIGSNFVEYWLRTHPDDSIIVLDALTYSGDVRNIPTSDAVRFVHGDVRNMQIVDRLVAEADIIVHFAAETHVTRSIADDQIFCETDILGTRNILAAAMNHRVCRVVHVSTSEVYGTAETTTMAEDHPLNPLSPYAAAKAGADRLVYSYYATHGLPATIVRPFNNYGPRQHVEKAIPRFITSLIRGESINLHGGGYAERDYIHVQDTCRAIDLIIQEPIDNVAGEAFNISEDISRSILSVAYDVIDQMGGDYLSLSNSEDRPGQVTRHTGNSSKLRKLTGWKPEISWDAGLRSTIAWYFDPKNRPLWEDKISMREVEITANMRRVRQ